MSETFNSVIALTYRVILHYDILEEGVDPAYVEPDLPRIYADAMNKAWYWMYQSKMNTPYSSYLEMCNYLGSTNFFPLLAGDDPSLRYSWKSKDQISPVINILQQPAEADLILRFAEHVEKLGLRIARNDLDREGVLDSLCADSLKDNDEYSFDLLSNLYNYQSGRSNHLSGFIDESNLTKYNASAVRNNISTVLRTDDGYVGKGFFSPHIEPSTNSYIKQKLDDKFRAVPYLVIAHVLPRSE